MARRYWPGQDPIGKRIRSNPADKNWRTVIGVVADTRYRKLRESVPILYFPWRQQYWQGVFAARLGTDLPAVLPVMRRQVGEVDSRLSIWQARTMDEFIAEPLAQPRLSALLLSTFGLVALTLAALGLYGIL